MTEASSEVKTEYLEAFADAWNWHDVDVMMTFFADDCVFIAGWGTRFEGYDSVREGVSKFFVRFPDGQFSDANHFISGDRGVSERIFTATGQNGEKLQMLGCDIFVFKNGKIQVKNAFRKEHTG